jgi:hypothetical protein
MSEKVCAAASAPLRKIMLTPMPEFDQPPTPSPPPTSFPFLTMRSTSATSSRKSPSKLGAVSRTESRHTDGDKVEKVERVLVFKDKAKAASASQANRELKSPTKSKKKTSKNMTHPLKPAAPSHTRSKSVSSLSKAQPPISSHTAEPSDHKTPVKISAATSTNLEILEQLQIIVQTRADIHLQLSILDEQEKWLLSNLLQSEPSTAASQTPELSSENNISNKGPLTRTLVLPPFFVQPIPIPVPSPYQPRKKPLPPHRPVSAPPQSTPSRVLTRSPSTSNRVPLSDKTEEFIATFDSTPIFTRPSSEFSPVKPRHETEGPEEVSHASDTVTGNEKGVRVPTKSGDENDRDMAKAGEVEAERREEADRGRELLARIDWPIRPVERTATPGKCSTATGAYEIPSTVQRKDWKF